MARLTAPRFASGAALPRVKSVDVLARGLHVLAVLERDGAAGLHALHGETAIPKASLLRILRTLCDAGRVSRRIADGAWVLSPSSADPAVAGAVRLVAAAAEPLRELARRAPCASDLAIHEAGGPRIVESNRPLARVRLVRDVLGYRPVTLWTAMGRACLAFSPPAERARILERLARSGARHDRSPGGAPWIEELVARTRARGYAERDARNIGPDAESLKDATAIAVPVLVGERVAACVSLVWPLAGPTLEEVVQRHLPLLRRAAGTIAARLADAPQPITPAAARR